MDGTPKKFIQRVLKINASTKSLVERLCDFKIYAVSVLSFIGSVCAPDEATLKAEAHALQCTTARPYNAIPTDLLGVGSVCGLGPDLVGIHSISLEARCRTAACSNTLNRGLEKIQAARRYDFAPVLALSPTWEKEFLASSWHVALWMLSMLYVVWTAMANLMRLQDQKQKVATGLLRYKLHSQDFAVPISLRLISRYRIADILPHMRLASRASHPGLAVGFLTHPMQRAMHGSKISR